MKNLPSFFRPTLLALALATGFGLSACNKESDYTKELRKQEEAAKQADDTAIQAYLKRRNITNYTRTESGLYLVPLAENTSVTEKIKKGQLVTVNYVGRLIGESNENTVFESSSNSRQACGCYTFTAGNQSDPVARAGWQEAILLMKRGDRKILLIPSHLAYGAQPYGIVPVFTPLLYDIEVINVQ
ncbi:FKBP-type peptidyl-prolyl cis-trans isomerase [Hymenobacter weizhouensis]|uniref:FKBP-type peptidyl-prolyl cis-trans isomerase n=1 Tax=Hymenobacter sp. YIM 151500-1 TaxID=2987689 RepID=UPI002226041D|nr:FKBP-type peptidyl-prolyl cis-trans isomerase [Hymenobacter sp. YIM 151500-1]UYZ61686.1 FKBP-type peptidyl-prolyl cis-trans isomerase [Hymenobacter sp. YIM 151500-1]